MDYDSKNGVSHSDIAYLFLQKSFAINLSISVDYKSI